MSDDINDYEEELTKIIAEIQKGIEGLQKIKVPAEKKNVSTTPNKFSNFFFCRKLYI